MAKKPKSDQQVAEFRARVCEAATRLFLERGPKNVSMRQIAAEMRVSAMTPYRYFSGRDEILATVRAAAFNKFADTLERAVKRGADVEARAQSLNEAYVRFAKRFPETYQLMFSYMQPGDDFPDLAKANARAFHLMDGYVKDLVDARRISGDPHVIGYMLWAALHGIVMLDFAGAISPKIGAKYLRQVTLRTLYGGIASDPPELPAGRVKPPRRRTA